MNKLKFILADLVKKLWVRCCFFCLFAVSAIICGPVLGPFIPDQFKEIVTTDSVKDILKILASSMLAVTTFSLSIMVQAFSAAATTASPRANKLLMQNSTALNALGSFIGAFLFSIVGLIAIGANFYNEDIVLVLFLFTVVMIIVIVVMLLKWIDQLSKLGRVSDTISIVEKALIKAIKQRAQTPYLCAKPLEDKMLNDTSLNEIFGSAIGYIQYIDIEMINNIAKNANCKIYIPHNPGKFLDSIVPIAFSSKKLNKEQKEKLFDAFIIGDNRTFEQDPRYGFVVLSEIALKALSPAVNDPGTAIDVIGTSIRCMRFWVDTFKNSEKDETAYEHVYITAIEESDILEDMYSALIFDVSKVTSVSIHAHNSLKSIAQFGCPNIEKSSQYWSKYLQESCKHSLSEFDCKRIFGEVAK